MRWALLLAVAVVGVDGQTCGAGQYMENSYTLFTDQNGIIWKYDPVAKTRITFLSALGAPLAISSTANFTHAIFTQTTGTTGIYNVSLVTKQVSILLSNLATIVVYNAGGTGFFYLINSQSVMYYDIKSAATTSISTISASITYMGISPDFAWLVLGGYSSSLAKFGMWKIGVIPIANSVATLILSWNNDIYGVTFHPDNSHFLLANNGQGTIIRADLLGNQLTLPPSVTDIFSISYSIDGTYAMIGTLGGSLYMYNSSTQTVSSSLAQVGRIRGIANIPGKCKSCSTCQIGTYSTQTCSASSDIICAACTNKPANSTYTSNTCDYQCIAGYYATKQYALLLNGATGVIWRFDPITNNLTTLTGAVSTSLSMALNPNYTYAVYSSGTQLFLLSLSTLNSTLIGSSTNLIYFTAYSRNGQGAYVAYFAGSIQYVNISTGITTNFVTIAVNQLQSIAISIDGKYLLASGNFIDKSSATVAAVWKVNTTTAAVTTFMNASATNWGSTLFGLSMHPDGTHFLASDQANIKILKVNMSGSAVILPITLPSVFRITHSPDGTYALMSTSSGKVYMYNYATNNVSGILASLTSVRDMAIIPAQCISCSQCSSGYYPSQTCSSTTDSVCSQCTSIPNATFTGAGTNATNCPFNCSAGYYKQSGQCTVCAIGTWSAAGATVCSQCTTKIPNSEYSSYETNNNCSYSCVSNYYQKPSYVLFSMLNSGLVMKADPVTWNVSSYASGFVCPTAVMVTPDTSTTIVANTASTSGCPVLGQPYNSFKQVLDNGALVTFWDTNDLYPYAKVTPNGTNLFAVDTNGRLYVWNISARTRSAVLVTVSPSPNIPAAICSPSDFSYILVANYNAQSIMKIFTSNMTYVTFASGGLSRPADMAMAPDDSFAVIVDISASKLFRLNLQSAALTVLVSITVPKAVVFSPDGAFVLIARGYDNPNPGTIMRYTFATNTLTTLITSPSSAIHGIAYTRPVCVACTPCATGKHILAPCNSSSDSICAPCTNLPANGVYAGAGTNATNCPFNCNAGFYYQSNQCISCSVGAWSAAGATVCTACTNGWNNSYYTSKGTNNTCAFQCTAGFFGTTNCSTCVAGKYCPGGQVSYQCPANTTSAAGSTTYKDCVCKAGTYGTVFNSSYAICNACLKGAFCSATLPFDCRC